MRLDLWTSFLSLLHRLKDINNLLEWLRKFICDFLLQLLGLTDSLLLWLSCNLSPDPATTCEGSLLIRDLLALIKDRDPAPQLSYLQEALLAVVMLLTHVIVAVLLLLCSKVSCVARLFHRDGRATHLAESLPVAGYGVSALHALQGNQEHARRAAGRCTNSNLALCGRLVGGLGGGPAGAVVSV